MFYHRFLGAACLLLVAAAVELYDEVPPVEMDNEIGFQDDNEIDTGPQHKPQPDDEEAARLQDLLLFRLMRQQMRDEQAFEHRANKNLQLTNVADIFSSLTKRLAPSDRGTRPQRRWKTKKGRGVGSQMVCYFKLCAFRNPA